MTKFGLIQVGGKDVKVKVLRRNPRGGSLSVEIIEDKDRGMKLCIQPYDLKEDKMPRVKPDASDKPYVSNYPPLQEWLDKHEARCMWQVPSNPKPEDAPLDWAPGSYIEGYMLQGANALVIIVVHSRKMGWDMFTSANTKAIDGTLLDAEERLGIKK